jgi:hypothetical protein
VLLALIVPPCARGDPAITDHELKGEKEVRV